MYARAFLRADSEQNLMNSARLQTWRRSCIVIHIPADAEFWEFPTSRWASARSCHLSGAGSIATSPTAHRRSFAQHVWAFLAMAMRRARSLGAITLASREKLDILFRHHCNLQRLDGRSRQCKIIQGIGRTPSVARWNVIKVIWGSDWDPLLEQDDTGLLHSG